MQKGQGLVPWPFCYATLLVVVVIGDELHRECNESPKWKIGDSATAP
jgi:hypothetical protein